MVRIVRSLALSAFALVVASVVGAEGMMSGPVSQRIVVFKDGTAPQARVRIASQSGGTVVRELKFINAVVVRLPKGQVRATESRLKANSEVLRIDNDPRINWLESRYARVADVPMPAMDAFLKVPFRLVGRQGLQAASDDAQQTPWGITRLDAPAAWAVTKGAGIKVGVVDTGIDFDHPDLKVAGGWNATDPEKPESFKDDNGHGTHVAGSIAALDNDLGVVGVAPEATLYGIKVLDANGSGTFSDVIAGMEWTVTNKLDVVNMSLGASSGNDSLKAAVEAMAKAGVILIAAAGNSGRAVGYPAAYPDAMAIAAMDSGDKVAWFSSRGPEVEFIAPGVSVPSTYMGGGYKSLSGTSMACPHVAGLAALAAAAQGASDLEAVRTLFKAHAAPLPDVPVEQQGAGVVNAGALVR